MKGKKIGIVIGVVATVIIIVAIITCSGIISKDSTFQIKVTGTEGLEFSGNYLIIKADGKAISKSVEGVVPTQYTVEGTIVSVVFQKQAEMGTLKVEIIKANEIITSEDTTAAYGVVSVATD